MCKLERDKWLLTFKEHFQSHGKRRERVSDETQEEQQRTNKCLMLKKPLNHLNSEKRRNRGKEEIHRGSFKQMILLNYFC